MVGSREMSEERELRLHRDFLSVEHARCRNGHRGEQCREQVALPRHNEEHQMAKAWHREMWRGPTRLHTSCRWRTCGCVQPPQHPGGGRRHPIGGVGEERRQHAGGAAAQRAGARRLHQAAMHGDVVGADRMGLLWTTSRPALTTTIHSCPISRYRRRRQVQVKLPHQRQRHRRRGTG